MTQLELSVSLPERLLARIESREAIVGVVGLGYVGLPLAEAFIAGGLAVIGYDVDAEKVKKLRRGQSYIGHIGDDRIEALLDGGRFEATTAAARLGEADAVILCVPTPLGEAREPDLSFIVRAGEALRPHLRPGQLVVLESSTYPGTTEEVLRPVLEKSGLVAGQDFFLAYSPEREDPGNRQFSTRNIPKVVGGTDDDSQRLAVALYETFLERVVPVSSARVAEACKILENTYRAVNIALVNELKVVFSAMGVDVWEVIEAAKTKPFGFQAFYPGPGLGGHCIPIDPFYLTWVARKYGLSTRFIELAGEVNTAMPQYVVSRVVEALNDKGKAVKGSRILLLGAAYKKDIDDVRESPALTILKLLGERGAVLSYNDPHVPSLSHEGHGAPALESTPLSEESVRAQDCVVIVVDHSAYDFAWVARHASLIVDTRNALGNIAAACPVWQA
jgi:UDP-N-acetyl-D-glucosamine dehydrogenase